MREELQLSPWQLRQAVRALNLGGIIAYPTEAVYGLGCNPLDAEAVLRLLELKQRPMDKGLILIASSIEQLEPYLLPLDAALEAKVRAEWPGPVTWLLPCRDETPRWIRGEHSTLAVRVTAHPVAAALCEGFGGAIISTSANISTRPPARNALTVQRVFGGSIDHIVHAPLGGRSKPTEIRDASSGRIVRSA